jgi:hypothetical protein
MTRLPDLEVSHGYVSDDGRQVELLFCDGPGELDHVASRLDVNDACLLRDWLTAWTAEVGG